MTVVSVTDGFSVSNSSFDCLYREKKLVNVCAYAFFLFYVKVLVRTLLRSKSLHLPRFNIQLAYPQHATHCLMRLKQPRVPITNGRAIRLSTCWIERSFVLQIHSDEKLENLNEFALCVISQYYPLIYGEEIVLPPGLTMCLRVKRW
jgi:hypothetical protein